MQRYNQRLFVTVTVATRCPPLVFHIGSMLNVVPAMVFSRMEGTLINAALVHGMGHLAAISLASRLHYNVTGLIP